MFSFSRQQAAWSFTAVIALGVAALAWPQPNSADRAKPSDPAAVLNAADAPTVAAQTQGGDHGPSPSASNSPWSAAAPASITPHTGQVPAALELPLLQASLSALQGNGADLSARMRSRHVVQVTDPRTADELARWGRQQGFAMSSDRFYLHGGVEAQMLYFDRHIVPDAQRIQLDGLSILQALTGMDTAEYGTWMGEINRP